jgi:F-type H+-transporting ATPase subunit b
VTGQATSGNPIIDLAIWTVVVFLVLLLVLRKFAWGPMLAGLKRREDNIRAALAEAEAARGEAQALRASLQKDMNEAHLKVKDLIDEAKRDAQASAAEVLAKARADIATDRERLHREIQTETDQALQLLWSRAAELATQASAMAIRRQLDGNTQRQLIDEALTEIRQAMPSTNRHA